MTHQLALEFATNTLASPISPNHLLGSYGLVGLLIIIFAECGLLIGFFLPGDTLLFSAGLVLAINDPSINLPSLPVLLVALPLAAILGNIAGYWIGRKAGPKVFDRPRSRLFRPDYVTRSQAFFDRYGAATIILARFVPVVRTVATVMAGVSRMRFSLYVLYSVIGGIIWTDGVLLLGYWLGHIEFVRKTIAPKIDLILVTVVILSLLPTLIHLLRSRRVPE
ncbi:DedA family protein [Jatrophihabitans sp. DSM 45814]